MPTRESGDNGLRGYLIFNTGNSINHEIIKRQRTSSDSPGPLSTSHTASHLADSDDDDSSATRPTASSLKKARSAAAENQRQRELTEREKVREAQRAEAAGRRKARAGRRRGDGTISPHPSQTSCRVANLARVNRIRDNRRPPSTRGHATSFRLTTTQSRSLGDLGAAVEFAQKRWQP